MIDAKSDDCHFLRNQMQHDLYHPKPILCLTILQRQLVRVRGFLRLKFLLQLQDQNDIHPQNVMKRYGKRMQSRLDS